MALIKKNEQEFPDSSPLTPQQRRIAGAAKGRLQTYKEVLVGDGSWGKFLAFEFYNLLFSNTPSIFGIGIRQYLLPPFLKSSGKGIYIGRGVTIRVPSQITLGRGAFVDDFAVLDVRTESEKTDSGITIGSQCFVGRGTILAAKGGQITLEDGVNISSSCRIATQSNISIGKGSLIAAYVYIGPGNHQIQDKSIPIAEQGMEHGSGVHIGENTWIGTRATILDGVTIGRDAVVGAHSLVREDVPDGAIVAGTPAKIIRHR